MAGALYVGAAAPIRTVFFVSSSGGAGFDLGTTESARLLVRFANGRTASWPAEVLPAPPHVALQPTIIQLVRVHDVEDIPTGAEGTARIRADVTLVGNPAPLRTRWRPVEILRDGI
jgi:hypothetical protein